MFNKSFYLFILFTLIFSQTWQPFHIEELKNHKNYNFNYIGIDQRALNIPITNNRRAMTHEVIGYLP